MEKEGISERDGTDVENDIQEIAEEEKTQKTEATVVKEGSFVVVQLEAAKRKVHFIAQIISMEEANFYKVKFLRRNGKRFCFPSVDDVAHIVKSEVVKILLAPSSCSSSREIYEFQDVSEYTLS